MLDGGDPAPHLACVAAALYWHAADEGLVDLVAVDALVASVVASQAREAPQHWWLSERTFVQLAVDLLELHRSPTIRARCALHALATAVAWLDRLDYPFGD